MAPRGYVPQAFAEDGTLADPGLQQRLTETVSAFLRLVEADVRYVCLERRWYGFPGTAPRPPSPNGPRSETGHHEIPNGRRITLG
ncbi:hypothetical protein GCM10010524_42510 [Streptomyces mexicanus]